MVFKKYFKKKEVSVLLKRVIAMILVIGCCFLSSPMSLSSTSIAEVETSVPLLNVSPLRKVAIFPRFVVKREIVGNTVTFNLISATLDQAIIFFNSEKIGSFKKDKGNNYYFQVSSLPFGLSTFTIIVYFEDFIAIKQVDVNILAKVNSWCYGVSGEGRNLMVTSLEPAEITSKVLLTFEIHGYEDGYLKDGQLLVDLGNEVIDYFSHHPEQLRNTALYIIPSANPDGLIDGWTNNGPGRCQLSANIDINRDFSYRWRYCLDSRHKTGKKPFSSFESRALRDLVLSIQPNNVLDIHGWLSTTYGDRCLCNFFENRIEGIGFTDTLVDRSGYFASWAGNQPGTQSALIELPLSIDSQDFIDALVDLCAVAN